MYGMDGWMDMLCIAVRARRQMKQTTAPPIPLLAKRLAYYLPYCSRGHAADLIPMGSTLIQ